MEPTASAWFAAQVSAYDSLIRRAVPDYDEMLARVDAYLPERATRVAELGCGTGNLSVVLAERYPDAELILVDAAPEMLHAARARLAPERRVRTVEARFEELDLAPRSLDLVTSCIAVHHVVDKPALFRRLHALLAPGGALVLADQMRGATDHSHAVNWDRMVAFWRRPGHLSADEQAELVEHAEAHDHYVPVPDQLRTLADAGFRDVDCVWRSWMWAIVTGVA